MPRITRIFGSFVIVVIAYGIYALTAVRWIEPVVDLTHAGPITPDDRARVDSPDPEQMNQLRGLFPKDSWELKNPIILESDGSRAKLLFQRYDNHPDGRVEIHPCTIVFPYNGPASEEQRQRQTVILEAPEGAVLQFDSPLDLARMKIGRLVRGQLLKKVTIRSDWKEAGPQDDLRIETSDVLLTEQAVSTPNEVSFWWGPHSGQGQDLLIKLLTATPAPGSVDSSPNVSGVELFELRRVERLHLDLGQSPGVAASEKPSSQKPASIPLDVNCRGAFRFDVVNRVATFRDRVDVVKPNPTGPADQLACELLSLYFAERPKPKIKTPKDSADVTEQPKTAGSLDLALQRIEASGTPAVLTAPSQKVVASGQRLAYNLDARSVALEGGQEVFFQHGTEEIHAKSLFYQAEQGRIGRVTAQGPGWLKGQSPDKPEQQLLANWKDQLKVEPDKQNPQNQVISLTGGAELNFPGVGQLQSREIFFWVAEKTSTRSQSPARIAG